MADKPKLVTLTPKAPEPKWDPTDALKEFVSGVESGKIVLANVMIFWVEPTPDGRRVPHYWTAGCSVLEQIGYGELIKQMAMDDWRQT